MKQRINPSALAIALAISCLTLPSAMAENAFRLGSTTVDSRSGREVGNNAFKGDMAAFFKVQKELVGQILLQIGLKVENLPLDIQRQINLPHTNNMDAFIAFSNGLDAMDGEKFDEAKTQFDLATQLDPSFALAVTFRAAMPEIIQNVREIAATAVSGGQKVASQALATGSTSKLTSASGASGASNSTITTVISSESGGQYGANKDVVIEAIAASTATGAVVDTLDQVASTTTTAAAEYAEKVKAKADAAAEAEAEADAAAAKAKAEADAAAAKAKAEADAAAAAAAAAAAEAAAQASYSGISTPPCVMGSLCGYYSVYLQGFNGATAADNRFVLPAFLTMTGVRLAQDETISIARTDGRGYLKATPSIVAGSTDIQLVGSEFKLNADTPAQSGGTVVVSPNRVLVGTLPDDQGKPALQFGYHSWQSYPAFMTVGGVEYRPFWEWDYFAEGSPTSPSQLTSLAQTNQDYTYSGKAGGDFKTPTGLDYCIECGTFNAVVNFSQANKIKSMNVEVPLSSAKMSISATNANLDSAGGFLITPTTNSQFRIGPPSGMFAASVGTVSGRTFGNNASAMGGVYALHGTNSQGLWAGIGSFGGTRPSAPAVP